MRGWTFTNEDSESDECKCEGDCKCDSYEKQVREMKAKIREEMINKLASEWNEVHSEIERQSWRSEDDLCDEADYLGEMCHDRMDSAEDAALELNPNLTAEERKKIRDAEEEKFEKEIRLQKEEKHLRLEVIESLLGDLGARMMRPYEHWNEEERYMEYMETRYDNDY